MRLGADAIEERSFVAALLWMMAKCGCAAAGALAKKRIVGIEAGSSRNKIARRLFARKEDDAVAAGVGVPGFFDLRKWNGYRVDFQFGGIHGLEDAPDSG